MSPACSFNGHSGREPSGVVVAVVAVAIVALVPHRVLSKANRLFLLGNEKCLLLLLSNVFLTILQLSTKGMSESTMAASLDKMTFKQN